MKTKTTIPIILLFLCFLQVVQSQTLKSNIKKSIVEIGDTFVDIPTERLKQLDQIAFIIFKNTKKNAKVAVLFIDGKNEKISQLAMVWLQTGSLFYGHSDLLHIESAGIAPTYDSFPKLSILEDFGFSLKNIRRSNTKACKIDYGSGNWTVNSKSLESLNSGRNHHVLIYLEKVKPATSTDKRIELVFLDTSTIAREMLYVSTRINNLLQKK
ncbi:hypothetical protein [Kordia sp.]|uniref:hypothetical protein n=1 Tax=Kordia sp. TaxID=1965332 RepID=UPI003D2B377F